MKIFYDVDTQNDFMNRDGKLYVPDAEIIKPNLAKLTGCAIGIRVPIVGSVDRHFGTEEYKERELELQRWSGPFPDHCMGGKYGQSKIRETNLTESRKFIPHRLDNKVPYEELEKAIEKLEITALFFEKQSYDVFTNPSFEVFLRLAKIDEAVVYGVATDYCVKAAVLGMQKHGIKCYVVEDAIKGVSPETTGSALEEMVKAGAKFVKAEEILAGREKESLTDRKTRLEKELENVDREIRDYEL